MSGIKHGKKRDNGRERVFYFLIFFLFLFVAVMVAITTLYEKELDKQHNEKVLYCELANVNANAANTLIPYFHRYMDESIETVGEVNQTLSHLLELRLLPHRDLILPSIDCEKPKCNSKDTEICLLITELKTKNVMQEAVS